MQRERATRWFGPTLLATAVAAAAVFGLAALVQTAMISAAPQAHSPIGSPTQATPTEAQHVTIEPYRIEVIGRRSPVQLGARANANSRGLQPG